MVKVKYLLIISTILLLSVLASAIQPIKVVLLDTGVNQNKTLPLCLGDHKTFFGDDLTDPHGHGTEMATIINREAKGTNFCFIIVKAYGFRGFNNRLQSKFPEALKYISSLKNIDFVNISGGGVGFDPNEKRYIKTILDSGARIIAASGNEYLNLDINCNYYPACYYPEIIVASSTNPMSNKGTVVDYIVKDSNYYTSQATAWVTGNLIRVLSKRK